MNFVIHIPHWFLVRATWFVVGLVAGSFIGRFAVVAFVYSAAYSGMKRW